MMERIIFIVSYEKKWGCWLVYADRAMDSGDYFLIMGRYAGEDLDILPAVREITRLIAKYDTQALFQQFGRKKYKDEREFLLKVDEDYIRQFIRPFVEKYVAQVIDGLGELGVPLFMRGNRLENLYKEQRLISTVVPIRALLSFERTEEHTRYVLCLTDGNRIFYPSDYTIKVLTRRPCRILVGKQLYSFPEDFDGQRLSPFLQKREILIPKANEQLYFQKFILKNIRHEEIEVKGFEVIIREVEKKAVLSLEREVFAYPVLALDFCYGNQRIPAWSGRKSLVELCTDGDTYAFYKVNRLTQWEQQQMKNLREMGLVEKALGHFQVPEIKGSQCREICDKVQETERERAAFIAWQQTVAWLREYREELRNSGIEITQKALRHPYYLGAWQLEEEVKESPDWFELRAEVILEDGRRIPFIRFREHILADRREFVLPDGSLFLIPEEWFARYSEVLILAGHKEEKFYLHKSQAALLPSNPVEKKNGGENNRIGQVDLPEGLRGQLRPYQLVGYNWLYHLYRQGLGGCLADDMGLGKTLQLIALILKYRQETIKRTQAAAPLEAGMQLALFQESNTTELSENNGEFYDTCLIVVPASLIHNWKNELRKFAPQLTVTVYAGYNRAELRAYLQMSDVVLITYHTLRNDIDYFARLTFGIIVADEAQMLKNPASRMHQAMLQLHGRWFYALSGTPVENSLNDLWAVMNLVNRGVLGSHRFFKIHFIKSVVLEPEGKEAELLRKLISPYILRRTKEEVLADLPELTTELVRCEPTEEQQKVYAEEQARVRNYLLGKREAQEGLRHDFLVLKALIRLRQLANHPRLTEVDYTGESGKFNEVCWMLEEVTGAGHRVLVFSSFVKYLYMVAEYARQREWRYAMLNGSTRDREQEIQRFISDPECRLFFISLKAGGVGLNLTEADYVFILDPWWNLAAENQAVGRAHRLGQKRAVFVYRFITSGTLEEKILAIQNRKQKLADAVISTSASIPLDDDELLEVLE